jgi:hypothetical protein
MKQVQEQQPQQQHLRLKLRVKTSYRRGCVRRHPSCKHLSRALALKQEQVKPRARVMR